MIRNPNIVIKMTDAYFLELFYAYLLGLVYTY